MQSGNHPTDDGSPTQDSSNLTARANSKELSRLARSKRKRKLDLRRSGSPSTKNYSSADETNALQR
ncbi:hypothetical protein OsI_30236 [Oryza sativa Indica Group]|nr:hypothetical protein OsI_30236 [Oryza sativa Indica Group]